MATTLIIGDIVGDEALNLLASNLSKLKSKFNATNVIVNGENAFNGKGINEKQIQYLKQVGVSAITSGNHIWNSSTKNLLAQYDAYVLRPDNYFEGALGKGVTYIESGFSKLAIVNIIGQSFMPHQVKNPFHHMDEILNSIRVHTKNIIVDFHAETTSEKIAMKWYLDGKVTCLVGTHTHVQTSDAEVTEKKTAYITDLGMSGPHNSVIGMDSETAISRFTNGLPSHYKLASGDIRISGVVLKFDDDNGKAESINAFRIKEDELKSM